MRGTSLFFLLLCLVLLPGGCLPDAKRPVHEVPPQSYKQLPGVTAEDIQAVEALKKLHPQFSYGMAITTEAFLTEDQKLDGFARLLAERLSTLFGAPFVPQAYGWDELIEKVDAKTVDFTGELTPTPEWRQRYFMTDPIFNRTIIIFTNKELPPVSVTAKERPLRVGFLDGATAYDVIKDTWSIPFEPYFLGSETEAIPLLQRGTLDAYIDESSVEAVFEGADFIRAADFYPLRYSPLSLTSANPEMKPIIDVVQKYLEHGGLNEVAELYKTGGKLYARNRLHKLFTEEERAYIRSHHTPETAVPVGIEFDNYPMAFYNPKDKEFQGIAVDVLHKVTRLTGLEFFPATAPEAPWGELLRQLEAGEIPLVSELTFSKAREGRFIWPREPYSEDFYALLSRNDYPDIDVNQIMYARVGLIEQTSATELFRDWFPDSTNDVVFADNPAAFAALERGDIDLLMSTQAALLSLTNYLEKPGFKANIVFQQPSLSRFGLNKQEEVLRSILDKSMRFIGTADISDRWKRKVFDYNSKMLRDMLPYTLGALALLIAGLVSVGVLLGKNRRMSRNLEFLVVQRTSELEHASRAKSDFLSSMSHEMRTPMNAIIGMTKIAEGTTSVARLRYCLATIGASSTHLLGIINDILDMSKIEAGKLELHEAPMNIEKMLIQICTMIFDKTEQKGQTLRIELDNSMHLNCIGDELRLSQVLTNLFSNAVKFTPEGGTITLSLHTEPGKDGRTRLQFSLADTGIGMTKEEIDRLFTAFTQADSGITKRFGGTGLGLAISKSIVEKMDGRIWVESEPDKGSTFFVEVELVQVPSAGVADVLRGIAPDTVRILVVAEDSEQRESLCSIINHFGMQCHMAENGRTALERIRAAETQATPYSVIFLICASPDKALECTRRMMQEADAEAMVIAASFSEWNAIEAGISALGVHRLISKPIFPSSVLNSISEVLGNAVVKRGQAAELPDTVPDFSGISLLLVEDVEINREIFVSLLEETGVRIESAENGQEAVRLFASAPEKYDIIIMDVQMPVMNGYEATRAIRALSVPQARTVPIIAMTANAFKEDLDKCLESGMNDHTVKPVDVKDLLEKIHVWTRKPL